MSEYDDIQVLSKTGCWPNATVPEWAVRLEKKYDTSPTHSVVIIDGLKAEIERLKQQHVESQAEIRRLHDALVCVYERVRLEVSDANNS